MVDKKSIYAKINNTNTNLSGEIDLMGDNIDEINAKIGESTDDYTDETLFGQLSASSMYCYESAFTYPSGTSSTTLSNGSYVEVIPANTITNPFSIVGLLLGVMSSSNGWYHCTIASGESGSEVDIASTAGYSKRHFRKGEHKTVTTPILPADTRVAVKLTGAGSSALIKLMYQEYS